MPESTIMKICLILYFIKMMCMMFHVTIDAAAYLVSVISLNERKQ